MAKIAVIFVLFALCSVAMSARITREEPNAFQPLLDSLKAITDAAQQFVNDPKTQAQVKTLEDKAQELLKKGGEQFQQAAGEFQGNLQELAKNSEGTFKELTETAKKAFDDLTKNKKN
ncbi:uncharacterized protein [Drosophila kikkawai]|uniref:Apolipophorin-3 n=1 Tax=Drosophila kikkawai TaxID=30033 RepID=A0A6P4IJF6_DROKI|nr:uncharacterized protein LOC108075114 [Drosophila kikkawai]